MTEETARPQLRIVSGDPTPSEIAALTAVLASASGDPEPEPEPAPSRWSAPAALMRPGTWPIDLSPLRYGQNGPGGQW